MRAGMARHNLLPIYLPSTTTTDLDSPFMHNLTQYHLVVNVMIRPRSEGKSKLDGESRSVCQVMHFVQAMRILRNFHLPLCKPFLVPATATQRLSLIHI